MTEGMTTTEERCHMGSNMPKPCPFPATVARPDESGETEPELCVFHAALIPLTDEVDELNVCLEIVRGYLEAVRQEPYLTHLLTVLERAEADFEERVELIYGAMNDLKAAEYSLIR